MEREQEFFKRDVRQFFDDFALRGLGAGDEDIALELQSRARDVLLTREIATEEGLTDQAPAEDLVGLEGMDEALAINLARHGIVTREDLAELAVDDMKELTDIEDDRAAALIMEARKIWFEEEA